MFSNIYRKEKSNQRNQIISKYIRETVKGTPSPHLKKTENMLRYKKLDKRWSRWRTSNKLIIMIYILTVLPRFAKHWIFRIPPFVELYNWSQFTWEKCYHLSGFFELQFLEFPDFSKRSFRSIHPSTLRKITWFLSHFYSNKNIVTITVIIIIIIIILNCLKHF